MDQAKILEDMSIEQMCMRCAGTSYKDIHFRLNDRIDRKFANLPFDGDNSCIASPEASLLHFGQYRKKSIATYMLNYFGDKL
jgi:hypothetical protein